MGGAPRKGGQELGRTRWAVAAFVVVSLLWFPFSIPAFEPGKARWSIKTSVPEGADLDHPTQVDLTDLIDATSSPKPRAILADRKKQETGGDDA